MKFTQLEPQFLKHGDGGAFRFVDKITDATGVMFLCPKCLQANGGRAGTHSVICWSPSVPAHIRPLPGRWELKGAGFHDLSLVAGSSSVKLGGGCNWHGFITNGEVTTCP